MKRIVNRKGSQAIEFALIFPVFVMLIFGGIDYLWYLLQRYQLTDAVASGCRAGALSAISPHADPGAIAGDTIMSNIGNMGDCDGVALCTVFIDDSEGPTDDVWMLECSAEIIYQPLAGMVPMPVLLTASSIQPVYIPEVEDTGY